MINTSLSPPIELQKSNFKTIMSVLCLYHAINDEIHRMHQFSINIAADMFISPLKSAQGNQHILRYQGNFDQNNQNISVSWERNENWVMKLQLQTFH